MTPTPPAGDGSSGPPPTPPTGDGWGGQPPPPPTGMESGGPWPPSPAVGGWGGQWPPPPYGYGWGGGWPPPRVGRATGPLLKPGFAPGPVFVLVTLVVLGVGVIGSSGFDFGWLAFLSVLIGLNIGLVWIIAFAIAAQDSRLGIGRRAWARWAVPPAIFFVAVALMMSGLPTTARFELSKPALEQAVADAQTGKQFDSGWIGLIDVHGIRIMGDTTLIDLSPWDWPGGCSLARAGADTSALDSWLSSSWNIRDYGNGWWYACEGGPSD
jgi:hypothetical protein